MAIYHLEAKVISRGVGRSAVAAAAYMSCSQILNDYDGVQHDYTRKQGLVWQQVFLPRIAPRRNGGTGRSSGTPWRKTRKPKDSRLAREFVVALPIELNKDTMAKVTDQVYSRTVCSGRDVRGCGDP